MCKCVKEEMATRGEKILQLARDKLLSKGKGKKKKRALRPRNLFKEIQMMEKADAGTGALQVSDIVAVDEDTGIGDVEAGKETVNEDTGIGDLEAEKETVNEDTGIGDVEAGKETVNEDTGFGSDVLMPAEETVNEDTGSGSDVLMAAEETVNEDTGSGSDVLMAAEETVNEDTGSGSDVLMAAEETVYEDTGSGSDVLMAVEETVYEDTGSGSDVLMAVEETVYEDTGSGSDVLMAAEETVYVDTGSGSDVLNLMAAEETVYEDTGFGSDVLIAVEETDNEDGWINVLLPVTEAGQAENEEIDLNLILPVVGDGRDELLGELEETDSEWQEGSDSSELSSGSSELESEHSSRKKMRKPDKWSRNMSKEKRNKGKAYYSQKGKQFPSKSIQKSCANNCSKQCNNKIRMTQRQEIFDSFWAMGDLARQRQFIATRLTVVEPICSTRQKARKLGLSSRNKNSNFTFEINGLIISVCKTFFMGTLDIGDRMVRTALAKRDSVGNIGKDLRGSHANRVNMLDPAIKEGIRSHINSFVRIESHYLRAQTKREYIDGSLTVKEMHRQYSLQCKLDNVPAGKYYLYDTIFNHEFNIGFHKPKKDQCTFCERFKNSTVNGKLELQDEFDKHQEEKVLSREKQAEDSNKAHRGELILATYDLEAVLPTPCGEINVLYYKRKLATYNFTVYDVEHKKALCYVWDESQAKRGANEIGTCVYKFLEDFCKGEHVVFYSDNCSGQNKNKFIVSMYLKAIQNLDILSITHNFLIVGHTQNEGDSVHSTIEKQKTRALKSGCIYVPAQWVTVIQTAKKNGEPYTVIEMATQDVFDLKKLAENTGKNFNITEANQTIVWNDIKSIRVTKGSPYRFEVKTSYSSEDYQTIDCRQVRTRGRKLSFKEDFGLEKAYKSPPGISVAKKADLMSLCTSNVIKPMYHQFFKDLKVNSGINDDEGHSE